MVSLSPEARDILIEEINGDHYFGGWSKEDPLASFKSGEQIFLDLVTKVLIYSRFFHEEVFFLYENVVYQYIPNQAEFIVRKDKVNSLKLVIRQVLRDSAIVKVVEGNPLLSVIK